MIESERLRQAAVRSLSGPLCPCKESRGAEIGSQVPGQGLTPASLLRSHGSTSPGTRTNSGWHSGGSTDLQRAWISGLRAASFAPYFLDGRLGAIRAPATLVWGENDGILPLDYARRMKDELPAANLQTIPRCGHIPHNECSEEFVGILREALGS